MTQVVNNTLTLFILFLIEAKLCLTTVVTRLNYAFHKPNQRMVVRHLTIFFPRIV